MLRHQPNSDYQTPIYTDNRRFRQEIPEVNRHFEAAKLEMDNFPKENGIIVDPTLVDFVNCPVCGSAESDQLFAKYGLVYAECPLCSHIFVKNRLKEQIILKLYESSPVDKLDRKVQQSPQHNEYYSKIYAKYLRYADSLNITNRNLLDVGCGAGEFLKFCSEHADFKLHANDFCEDTYDQINRLVGQARFYFRKKIEEIDFGSQRFGLITLWGVFEHVVDPIAVFKKCASLIDDSGFVLILVPNIHSRAFKILGIQTPTINPRAHLNFYSEKSLQIVCRRTGLELFSFFQELPVIDLMYEHIDYDATLVSDILRKREAYYHIYFFRKSKRDPAV